MIRFVHLAVLVAGIDLLGCGGASLSPAKPPARMGAESTRTRKGREPPPRLIAPPPAYGNKIVMAGQSAPTVTN